MNTNLAIAYPFLIFALMAVNIINDPLVNLGKNYVWHFRVL